MLNPAFTSLSVYESSWQIDVTSSALSALLFTLSGPLSKDKQTAQTALDLS